MPAYDRPIHFNLEPREREKDVAAVIQFTSRDFERCKAYLKKLQDAGIIDSFNVQQYNPDHSSPELYFP